MIEVLNKEEIVTKDPCHNLVIILTTKKWVEANLHLDNLQEIKNLSIIIEIQEEMIILEKNPLVTEMTDMVVTIINQDIKIIDQEEVMIIMTEEKIKEPITENNSTIIILNITITLKIIWKDLKEVVVITIEVTIKIKNTEDDIIFWSLR